MRSEDRPIMLAQTQSVSEEENITTNIHNTSVFEAAKALKKKREQMDTGVLSTKHNNTRITMMLYFCIITVLTCCCLGRCLIVPLSQASNYELNSHYYLSKKDKGILLQKEIVN